MAECGHCGNHVKGIRDHIRDKHGEPFYDTGPDFKYYGYRYLKNIAAGLSQNKLHWDAVYEEMDELKRLENIWKGNA